MCVVGLVVSGLVGSMASISLVAYSPKIVCVVFNGVVSGFVLCVALVVLAGAVIVRRWWEVVLVRFGGAALVLILVLFRLQPIGTCSPTSVQNAFRFIVARQQFLYKMQLILKRRSTSKSKLTRSTRIFAAYSRGSGALECLATKNREGIAPRESANVMSEG